MRKNLDKKWERMYSQITMFMRKNRRKPSKHYLEERGMSNWIKYNKKRYTRGLMEDYHIKKFEKLLSVAQSYYHVNQYDYPTSSPSSEALVSI